MKTLREWEERFPDKELNEYLQHLDEVDEELRCYCGEIVAPQFTTRGFLQMGEAVFKENGVYYYTTFMTINDRHYYLGPMPEFK